MKLLPYMGAAIGDKYSSAEVVILADDRDGLYTELLISYFSMKFQIVQQQHFSCSGHFITFSRRVFCMICRLSLRGQRLK